MAATTDSDIADFDAALVCDKAVIGSVRIDVGCKNGRSSNRLANAAA
jgi:hypothetical protein